MNVTYRRAVQQHFASWLGEREVDGLRSILDKVAPTAT
jgi:hypothetical protein